MGGNNTVKVLPNTKKEYWHSEKCANTTKQKYENIFSGLDTTIDINDCNNAIKKRNEKVKFSESKHNLAVTIRKDQTKKDLSKFLLAACFRSVRSTFLTAIINNHFKTWPGMEHNFK